MIFGIIKGILLFVQAVISIVLILLVMSQTSKNEGFGTIGVQAPTNFKGMPGFEERMQGYTRMTAISWFVIGIFIMLVFRYMPAS